MQPSIITTKQIGNYSILNDVSGDFTIGGDLIANGQTIMFPPNSGSANQFLQTNGSGSTVWASDYLANLSDVTISGPAASDLLQYDGSRWRNMPFTGGLANVSCSGTTTTITGSELTVSLSADPASSGVVFQNATTGTSVLQIATTTGSQLVSVGAPLSLTQGTLEFGAAGTVTVPDNSLPALTVQNAASGASLLTLSTASGLTYFQMDTTLRMTPGTLAARQGSIEFRGSSGNNVLGVTNNLANALSVIDLEHNTNYLQLATTVPTTLTISAALQLPLGSIALQAPSSQNTITVPDALASALTISNAVSGLNLLSFSTATGAPAITAGAPLTLATGGLSFGGAASGQNVISIPNGLASALSITNAATSSSLLSLSTSGSGLVTIGANVTVSTGAVYLAGTAPSLSFPTSQSLTVSSGSQQILVASSTGLQTAVPQTFGAGVQYNSTASTATSVALDNTATLWEFSSTSTVVATLPVSTALPGQRYVIAKTGSGGSVTIQTQAGDTINGSLSSITLTGQYDHSELINNGAGIWYAL